MIKSNERKKNLVRKMAEQRKRLKATGMDRSIPLEDRFQAFMKLAQLPRNSSPVRLRRRCIATGRPRGVYRFCNLSRVVLRQQASHGQLPGVRRSSW